MPGSQRAHLPGRAEKLAKLRIAMEAPDYWDRAIEELAGKTAEGLTGGVGSGRKTPKRGGAE